MMMEHVGKSKIVGKKENTTCKNGKNMIYLLNDVEVKIWDRKIDALKRIMAHYHMGKDVYFNPAAISGIFVYVL